MFILFKLVLTPQLQRNLQTWPSFVFSVKRPLMKSLQGASSTSHLVQTHSNVQTFPEEANVTKNRRCRLVRIVGLTLLLCVKHFLSRLLSIQRRLSLLLLLQQVNSCQNVNKAIDNRHLYNALHGWKNAIFSIQDLWYRAHHTSRWPYLIILQVIIGRRGCSSWRRIRSIIRLGTFGSTGLNTRNQLLSQQRRKWGPGNLSKATTWTTWTTRSTWPTWPTDHPDQLNHSGNPEWLKDLSWR